MAGEQRIFDFDWSGMDLAVAESNSVEPSKTVQRLKKGLERQVGKAIADYNMIEDGDTVRMYGFEFDYYK